MTIFFILAALSSTLANDNSSPTATCNCGEGGKLTGNDYITGGQVVTDQNAYPWQVHQLIDMNQAKKRLEKIVKSLKTELEAAKIYENVMNFLGTDLPLREHCGASIISAKYVVTAAHCLHLQVKDRIPDNVRQMVAPLPGIPELFKMAIEEKGLLLYYLPEEMILKAGVKNWKTETGFHTPVEGIKIHEHYNPIMDDEFGFDVEALEYDIAILTVKESFPFSNKIAPICLPSSTTLYTGQIATVTGWGGADPNDNSIKSDVLKEAKVKVWKNDNCMKAFKRHCTNCPEDKPLTRYIRAT